jgi:hypothetical protein
MGPTALLPLWRKACWGFFRPKNPTASAGCEPPELGYHLVEIWKNSKVWIDGKKLTEIVTGKKKIKLWKTLSCNQACIFWDDISPLFSTEDIFSQISHMQHKTRQNKRQTWFSCLSHHLAFNVNTNKILNTARDVRSLPLQYNNIL